MSSAYRDYGEIRWKLCCGDKTDSRILKKAVEELYGAVRPYLPYILTVCRSKEDIGENDNVIYIGTEQSNPALLQLEEEGFFLPEHREEGYSIRVGASPRNPERTDIVIQGADEVGTLYGVFTFESAYLDTKLKYNGYHYEYRHKPFLDACIDFTLSDAPAISRRGFWTWGHRIFDYRRYFLQMARCRMNTVIIWNDSVPLNAKEIVEEAHALGIRVIWGYTCAWGENIEVDPTKPEELDYWSRKVLEIYEQEYLPTGGDGIYFQGFTERLETEINDVPVADLITAWINRVTEILKKAHPDLLVQFGIHATSIRDNWKRVKLISDVTPVWEDCGGFPYHYDPRKGEAKEALDYTKDLLSLAKGGNFACVLKGFTVLKWKQFEHYKGDILAGLTDEIAYRDYRREQEFYWRFAEPYWIYRLEDLKNFCRTVALSDLQEATVMALVEDGVPECGIPRPLALFSEVLWNWNQDSEGILERVFQSRHYEE